jgi:hypothetical protein
MSFPYLMNLFAAKVRRKVGNNERFMLKLRINVLKNLAV